MLDVGKWVIWFSQGNHCYFSQTKVSALVFRETCKRLDQNMVSLQTHKRSIFRAQM